MLTILVGDSGWCEDSILIALKAGYGHLDCTWAYGVNRDIRAVIKEFGIPREELFITTKFWPHFAAPIMLRYVLICVLKKWA